jgi:hypothetical protein
MEGMGATGVEGGSELVRVAECVSRASWGVERDAWIARRGG